MSMDQNMNLEEKLRALSEEHEQLKGELMTVQLDKEELFRKYEIEDGENKILKEALAQRDEVVRELDSPETHSGAESKVKKALEKENTILKNTNKMILLILSEQRAQLKKLFWEKTEKSKEAFKLQESIKKLEWDLEKVLNDKTQMESEASEYAKTVRKMMEEMNEQANNWEIEKLEMSVACKESEKKLKKEIESLKTQKEDIVNHSKNSEKLFSERIALLEAEIERLQKEAGKRVDLKTKFGEVDYAAELLTLNDKLEDALEAIEELEGENTKLRTDLDGAIANKLKAEGELDFQKSYFREEQQIYLDDCQKYENQIANLNEEMVKIEEIRDQFRRDLEKVTEKQTRQTVTFSNEKAKFCHDMERVEEKWHCEVLQLVKKNEDLEKWLKDSLVKKDLVEEKVSELRGRAEEAEMSLAMMTKESEQKIEMLRNEVAALEQQLSKANERQKDTEDSWNNECTEMEDELSDLYAERKTREKRLNTMYHKYDWLLHQTRNLSDRRREELADLKDRINLLKREKNEWMAELRADVNSWKEHVTEQAAFQKRMEELETAKEALEEKIDTVTDKWREECELYEENIATLNSERKREREEALKTESRLQRVAGEKRFLEAEVHNMLLENAECTTLLREKDAIIKGFEAMVNEMKTESNFEKDLLRNAIEEITELHKKLEIHKNVYSTEKTLLMEEIESMKKEADQLRKNLGVETIDDDDNESECSDDSELGEEDHISTISSSCAEDDQLYDDMPTLKAEEVQEDIDEDEEKEEDVTRNSRKDSESEDWELVADDM